MEFVEILKKIEERLGYEIVALVHPDGSGSIFRIMSKFTNDEIIETFHNLEGLEALINKKATCVICEDNENPATISEMDCSDYCQEVAERND